MIEPESQVRMKQEIADRIEADQELLRRLRQEIRPLKRATHRIQPRTATAVSLVGTDGGNNSLQFDPFFVQLIRVVDSSNNEYCLEAVTPTTNTDALSDAQFEEDGSPKTALGRMMSYLGVRHLSDLSSMIRRSGDRRPMSQSWVQVYRELVEWAILFHLVREKDWGTDTLIVFDGLLRSKKFKEDKFVTYRQGLKEGIEWQRRKGRRIFIVGIAKRSNVLSRYRLAMALEGVLTTEYPAYVEVPRGVEEKAYNWAEWARGDDSAFEGTEANKFVAGKMFLVKFGPKSRDPVWPVDIYLPQKPEAQVILGYLLADAENGFPVPYYPQCLQKAHENAALVDFDFDVLQDQVYEGLRNLLGGEARTLDAFRLQDADPARARY